LIFLSKFSSLKFMDLTFNLKIISKMLVLMNIFLI